MRNISSFGWFVILCGVYWIVYWLVNRKRAPGRVPVNRLTDAGRLKGACFGDQGKADRLVQYEKNRHQGITHAEAVRRALERLETDRGR